MECVSRCVPRGTNTIKALEAIEQASILRDLAPQYLSRAAAIRDVLETHSSGIVRISVGGTDEQVVLLALLTAVVDDIASVPDAKRMTAFLAINERVAAELGFEKEDVRFFVSNCSSVVDALRG